MPPLSLGSSYYFSGQAGFFGFFATFYGVLPGRAEPPRSAGPKGLHKLEADRPRSKMISFVSVTRPEGVMAGRTIAIGDIHGCPDALAALLDAVAPGREDTVVTLGDYIDRGPDSRRVLDRLIALAGRCRLVPLLGNHEEALLSALCD